MEIPRDAKLYRLNSNFEIEQFTYLFNSEGWHSIEDNRGVTIKVSSETLRHYNLSKRMVLTESEELLRSKINLIHEQMRSLNMSFFKIDSVCTVYSRVINKSREIHRYNLNGLYIDSFTSVSQASSYLQKAKTGSIIYECATGKRHTAYGYRWSWDKVRKLS